MCRDVDLRAKLATIFCVSRKRARSRGTSGRSKTSRPFLFLGAIWMDVNSGRERKLTQGGFVRFAGPSRSGRHLSQQLSTYTRSDHPRYHRGSQQAL